MNPDRPVMRLILNMRFQLTEGNWQRVSRARCVLSASLQSAPSEECTRKNQPATFDMSHHELLGSLENITRGPQKCACGLMCYLTAPFLSLMSHQCTLCASAFCKLECINTSVLSSRPASLGGGVGVRWRCTTFVLIFVMVYYWLNIGCLWKK